MMKFEQIIGRDLREVDGKVVEYSQTIGRNLKESFQ